MLYKSRILGKEYGIKCGAIWDHHGVCMGMLGITKGNNSPQIIWSKKGYIKNIGNVLGTF
jgi:hypothetical protein